MCGGGNPFSIYLALLIPAGFLILNFLMYKFTRYYKKYKFSIIITSLILSFLWFVGYAYYSAMNTYLC
jgi:hypothetical protein